MQISSSIQNSYITQITSTNSVQKTTKLAESSFVTEASFTPPNQLSYEDYQSISFKDLDTLYPPKTTGDKNGYSHITNEDGNDEIHREAVKLWQVANTFEDDTLGKTLFTQVNKENPSEIDELINQQISTASDLKWLDLIMNQIDAIDNYVNKKIEQDPPFTFEKYGKYANEFRQSNNPDLVTDEEIDYAIEHTRVSSERFFEMVNLSLNDTKDWGNPNRVHFSDTYKTQEIFIHIDEVMAEFSKLRAEYQQKLQEIPEYRSVEVFV